MREPDRLELRAAAVLAAALLAGCSLPVASGIGEAEANRAVVALEENGISAEKERDPESEGRFRVTTARDDAAAAAFVLSRENLPPAPSPGVLETLGEGSVVPSRLSEHARFLAGVSGELESSLRAVDGVVSVRVHLAAPERSPLDTEEAPTKPSASVLLRHRGATPPLAVGEIQRLVAGAVPGLAPEQVSVVASAAPALGRPRERELSRLGPITVTRASLTPLRAVVAVGVLLNLALVAAVGLLWSKVRRAERELSARAEAEPAPR